MAIDSLAKRQSALIDAAGMLTPDATIGASDRVALLGQYGGLSAAVPIFVRHTSRRTQQGTSRRYEPYRSRRES